MPTSKPWRENKTEPQNVPWVLTAVAWASFPFVGKKSEIPVEKGLISGKYQVDILPEAHAKLDTIAPLCIADNSHEPIYLRLSVNGTWPSAVKLSRAVLGDFSHNSQHVYSSRDIAKFPQRRADDLLFLPISEPGAYFLDGITDSETGFRVKIHRERVIIPPCPKAEIKLVSDGFLCPGEELHAEVHATGVSPLTITVDGQSFVLGKEEKDDGVASVVFPLKRGSKGLNSLNVQLNGVQDRLGCETKFAGSKVSASVIRPVKAELISRTLANVHGSVNAELKITGTDGPFNVELEGPDGPFNQILDQGTHSINLKNIGEYKAVKINGSRCAGTANGLVNVFSPPQVDLTVDFMSIEDKCAGPSGVDAHVDLKGSAPWSVGYRTLKNGRVVSERRVDLDDPHNNVIQLRPQSTGEFVYEITYVEDRYRHKDVSFRISQQVNELPGARFDEIKQTKLCGTNKAKFGVLIKGRGPFTLKYSIDDKIEEELVTTAETDSDRVDLEIEFVSGMHFVRLLSMADRNGCVTDLRGVRSPDIMVRMNVPVIGFANPTTTKLAEPISTSLPLSATNLVYPATVVFEHNQNNKLSQSSIKIASPEDAISCTLPGSYTLLSLNDGVCGGSVNENKMVSIGLYDRPTIEMVSGDAEGCLGLKKPTRKFNLTGSAPFTITHETVDPNGRSHVKKIHSESYSLNVSLDTGIVGEYSHYMWVSDTQYDQVQQKNPLVFKHNVWPLADAQFEITGPLSTCENTKLPERVPVALKGKAPFSLKLAVGSEVKIVNVNKGGRVELGNEIGPLNEPGTTIIKILEVDDQRMCRAVPSNPRNQMEVNVLPRPPVPQVLQQDYCVGERVSFNLPGQTGAFDIVYNYNGHTHRASNTVLGRGGAFDIRGLKPGNVTVTSVSDVNGCTTLSNVSAEVHKLPSSTITEEPHFSIYEGDQVNLGFAFEGTAPFTFTYVHIVDGAIKERKTVRNVMENTYSLTVDEGGEYEIIELQDKFCRSSRI